MREESHAKALRRIGRNKLNSETQHDFDLLTLTMNSFYKTSLRLCVRLYKKLQLERPSIEEESHA